MYRVDIRAKSILWNRTLNLFAVCIPTFNAKRCIRESLINVTSQVFNGWELVVCDDCSADAMFDEIRLISDCDQGFAGRLTVISMGENSDPFSEEASVFES